VEYKVVYIVTNDTSYLPIVLWLLVIGLAAFCNFKSKATVITKIIMSVFICFMLVAGLLGLTLQLAKKQSNISWLNSANVTEGYVENFDPAPATGHKYESFTINGKKFRYSDYDISRGGFNQTQSHGGPMYEGRWVRISYVGDTILKIEVRE
jgi:hypothetical protein